MSSVLPPTVDHATPDTPSLGLRHKALSHPYQFGPSPILERQSARESNARSYPRRLPIALRRGQGLYLEDVEGRVFIDCLAGAGTLALGHNHPVVVAAIRGVLDVGLPLHTLDLTTPVKDEFVETLFSLLPSAFARDARIQFCGPTGADAIEASLKLVKVATGRQTILSFHGGYHGMSQGALGLMGNLAPKSALGGQLSGVQFLPYPYEYRSPFGLASADTTSASLHYIQTMLSDPESGVPAAAGMVLEVVQGEGGVVPAPDQWMRGLRDITRDAGVPLILDEVQTGLGRTGKMFAFEHSGVMPDVLVLSKAIGGSLPLSAVVYKGELDKWLPGAHAGTFRGNQLAMAAGSATMRYILAEGLHEHAERMGQRLQRHLRQLQSDHAQIGDVRGRGLMIGMELIDPQKPSPIRGQAAGAPRLASQLQRACLERGLILELGGRHGSVVRLLPPLTISEREVDLVAQIMAVSMDAIVRSPAAN
ncbi:MAG: aminotransferase class III-fold pyridoxal phosphate-dependent enzyme [Rubrivivax sp.]|nr:MAG: aminotransferase class III-fold pyridoxal phosphate-dependent enzyme [Rubrivivax sp.]